MRLGRKITFFAAILGLVLVAIFSISGSYFVGRLVKHDLTERSEIVALLVSRSVTESLLNEDLLSVQIALSSLGESVPDLAYLVISSPDRKIISKAGPAADRFIEVVAKDPLKDEAIAEHAETGGFVSFNNSIFFDVDRSLIEGRYILHTGLSTGLVGKAYQSFLATTLVVDVVILLAVIFVILYYRRFFLAPIIELGRRTRQISLGKFETILPEKVSDDEIGDLERDFSAMAGELKGVRYGLEIKVRERTKDLEETKEQYRQLFETTPLCVKIIDRNGKVILMNKTGREEHFIKDEAELGKWDWYQSIEAKFRPQVKRAFDKALGGEFSEIEFKHDPSGSKRKWCLTFLVPINGSSGKVKQVLAYSLDVSDRKASEAKVKELNELRVKFIQIVSHQLRTPLNAIRWNLEALLGEEVGKLKKEQKEFVRITHDANVEVIRRIRDLLTAMDIEEGRVILEKGPASLESLWATVIGDYERRGKIKNLVFSFVPPKEPLPEISVDTEKIRAAIEAIADNAFSYTPEKGSVTTSIALKDEFVRFEIKDTGIGIPVAERPRIFTRFFRASNAATMKPDASGLGLSIAKYYVEQHGGNIGFESREGRGSTFWFELPVD